MRQHLGPRKLDRLRKQTGLDISVAMVRGGTGHRIDLCLSGGKIKNLWPNGEITDSEWGWTQ